MIPSDLRSTPDYYFCWDHLDFGSSWNALLAAVGRHITFDSIGAGLPIATCSYTLIFQLQALTGGLGIITVSGLVTFGPHGAGLPGASCGAAGLVVLMGVASWGAASALITLSKFGAGFPPAPSRQTFIFSRVCLARRGALFGLIALNAIRALTPFAPCISTCV